MTEKTCTCPCDKETCKGTRTRKIHYIDVGTFPSPEATAAYLDKIKHAIRTAKVDDEQK
jgi:hypothetical protein